MIGAPVPGVVNALQVTIPSLSSLSTFYTTFSKLPDQKVKKCRNTLPLNFSLSFILIYILPRDKRSSQTSWLQFLSQSNTKKPRVLKQRRHKGRQAFYKNHAFSNRDAIKDAKRSITNNKLCRKDKASFQRKQTSLGAKRTPPS